MATLLHGSDWVYGGFTSSTWNTWATGITTTSQLPLVTSSPPVRMPEPLGAVKRPELDWLAAEVDKVCARARTLR